MISCLFPRGNKRRVNGGKSNRSMLSLFTKSTPCVFVPNFLFISQALSIYPQFVLLSRVYQTIKCECLTSELLMLSCVSYQWCWSSQCLTGSFTFVMKLSHVFPQSPHRVKYLSWIATARQIPKQWIISQYIFDVTFQIHIWVPYLSITWRDLNPPICWLSNWLQAWRKSYYALMTSAALGLAQPWPRW